jgi:hypothetical protein
MRFEEAIRISIRKYFDGIDPEKVKELEGERKYTREYFDELESEVLNMDEEDMVEEDTEEDGIE